MMGHDTARMARVLDGCNAGIIAAAAARRQGIGSRAPGDRSAPGLAAGAVDLVEISARRVDGVTRNERGELEPVHASERVTPAGYLTARRRAPSALRGLPEDDPRAFVAAVLVTAAERVGSVKGSAIEGGSGGCDGKNDGGATSRVIHATRLRMIEAGANGWRILRGGKIERGPDRVALKVQRASRQRADIMRFPAICSHVVNGLSLDEILRRAGWAANARNRDALRAEILLGLECAAAGMGMVSAPVHESS